MTDSFLNNPHDRFFKESFSRKETALSFIREYLPEPIIGALEGGSWMQEGMQKGKLEDAVKMIARGMSDEDIVDITGLELKKIQELRKENDSAAQ